MMKIVLATGIYPPEIGGPATYVKALAKELTEAGHQVVVVTYGEVKKSESWELISVSKSGGPLLRWWRYSRALKRHGADADIVYAFSSVSCGVPLLLAGLKKPKKLLRLGGDFLWERYTDAGGSLSLREYYKAGPSLKGLMQRILIQFDHIVFSTLFQQEIYEEHYSKLPSHSVLENAQPAAENPLTHQRHDPFRLLSICRFVKFKNLQTLIKSMKQLPSCTLTLVGSGPEESALRRFIAENELQGQVVLLEPVQGQDKRVILDDHDLFVVPSFTDISPNAALEAIAAGLPVLITKETGLSPQLLEGMTSAELQTEQQIHDAIENIVQNYASVASQVSVSPSARSWQTVAQDHLSLFQSL